jgi:hypothetical protein
MNWVTLSLGVGMISFMAWLIIAGRKETSRINSGKK